MRINLYGGPGAGKSTTAAWLFAKLKLSGFSVEHVGEYVKAWAYAHREVKEFDQVYILGKQMQYEYRFLSNGVKNIVTDSPVFNSMFYAPRNLKPHILGLIDAYEAQHEGVNIFLDRRDKPYVQEGRYQTEQQANQADINLKCDLASTKRVFRTFNYNDRDAILDYVMMKITR